jgi:hypothetical protein
LFAFALKHPWKLFSVIIKCVMGPSSEGVRLYDHLAMTPR